MKLASEPAITLAMRSNCDSMAILDMINSIYAVEEAKLWKDGHLRTTLTFINDSIQKNEILIATLNDELVGVVHTKLLESQLGWFGMLVVPNNLRGVGIASALYKACERRMQHLGCTRMQCEVLIPEKLVIPMKRTLQKWYKRLGYRLNSRCPFTNLYPSALGDLKRSCYLEIYIKELI